MPHLNLDDELLQDYLAECREHLATIEADLLTIEQNGEQIDEQLVNRVFRAAHSIKGGAGFFDLGIIHQLAHRIENVLDLIRSRQMMPTPEIVNTLFRSFDKLRDLLDHHQDSGSADISEYVEALTGLVECALPLAEKPSVKQKVEVPLPGGGAHIEVSAFDMTQARKGGKSVYLIAYDLIHDIQRNGKTPLEVFRKLDQFGSVMEMMLDIDSAGTLDDEPVNKLLLEVLYATPLDTDLIREVVHVPAERIQKVEADGSVRAINAPRPAAAPPAPAPQPAPKPEIVAAVKEPEPKPAPTPSPTPTPAPVATPSVSAPESTVRLNVTLLDSLMTLAGELVLSRNQLNESLARRDDRAIRSGAQRINLVTSELQEVVTLTRMQPIGTLFSKFSRLVRDLSRNLDKDVQLHTEGAEVEIDKTILEGLSDPLTHMVRNAVDHGIEGRADRLAKGKSATGNLTLRACHQAGQVLIEIVDDGRGLAVEKVAASSLAKGLVTREQLDKMSDREKLALVFLPGVSTAEKVSDVSGRGVGMDVVKTNLDKLGGKIEIESAPGRGASFRIKLPLTLAIIPSLLVSDGGERFAIPQVNVGELIRIPAAQIAQRTDRVGDALVLTLRDHLVPLVHLADAMGTARSQQDGRPMNVVLVNTGAFAYGLIVEELHDTAEIVVKPLGRHLKGIQDYAGATILGDGRVAVILDVAGIAARSGVSAGTAETVATRGGDEAVVDAQTHSLLLFHNAPNETCAVPIANVSRIERVKPSQVETVGGRRTMLHRGASLRLVTLCDVASAGELTDSQQYVVIVFERMGRPIGLLAAEPLDMIEANLDIDTLTLRQRGIAGSAVLKNQTVLMLSIDELAEAVCPSGYDEAPAGYNDEAPKALPAMPVAGAPTVLLAEDSEYFRHHVQRLIESIGCNVITAEDGAKAWDLLEKNRDHVDLVATDIEMPHLDGLSLTRQIRADKRFENLPVIALSSLAGEEDIARALEMGVSEYKVKLNEDELTECIRTLVMPHS
ncbi:MAG: chemotaxis protein CheW [Acidobacteria bacterium]|nr:chemotaxis protein CheW [Acidobacteriota bacterium]